MAQILSTALARSYDKIECEVTHVIETPLMNVATLSCGHLFMHGRKELLNATGVSWCRRNVRSYRTSS
jgi:hypothetical protein